MPRRASNADRIAKAAAEADAKAKDKAEKKAKKPPAKRASRPRAAATPPRLKIVWAVAKPGAAPSSTFPYAQRAAADAEAARIGGDCRVSPLKVPMEPGE